LLGGSLLLSGRFFTIRFSSACDRDAVTGPVATSCTESDGLGGGWVTTRGAGSKTLAFQSINNFRLTISVKRQLFVVHFRQFFVVPHTLPSRTDLSNFMYSVCAHASGIALPVGRPLKR
jgi:hypothetical protein